MVSLLAHIDHANLEHCQQIILAPQNITVIVELLGSEDRVLTAQPEAAIPCVDPASALVTVLDSASVQTGCGRVLNALAKHGLFARV